MCNGYMHIAKNIFVTIHTHELMYKVYECCLQEKMHHDMYKKKMTGIECKEVSMY